MDNKYFTIDIPIFEVSLHFLIGNNIPLKDIEKITSNIEEITEIQKDIHKDSILGITFILAKTYLVYIKDISDYNTISHEIFHAVFNILKDKNIKISVENEEVFAYLIGYITEKVYNNINNN